jgi:hypothetical protein
MLRKEGKMAKFFDKVIDKFFDFFNFGRFITIIVPGLITALCFTMLVSQLIFPIGKELEQGLVPKIQSIQSKETTTEKRAESKKKDSFKGEEKNKTSTKETTTSNERGKSQGPGDQEAIKKENKEALFNRQLAKDYARVSSNFFVVLLLTIVLGLMLYEVGYWIITFFPPRGEELELFSYDPQHDADNTVTQKFAFTKKPVGLVYFAPFLKEKFSGEENYFNFLVTEYYRFLEFSVNMPISIIVSGIIGIAYYVLFSIRNSYWPYYSGFKLLFLMLFVCSIAFLLLVFPRINKVYKKASKDLVRGVSDLMSKGLVKL